MAHGLAVILDAAERLRHDRRIAFLLVGDGAERIGLEKLRDQKQLDNVLILGQRAKDEMPRIWAATDASLILLRRSDLFKKVVPSKMFEAMAMRCPIILGVEGEARTVLDDAGAGIGITPENADELTAAVVTLAQNPALARQFGDRGRAHVLENYDRNILASRYLNFLEKVAAEPDRGRRVMDDPGHSMVG